MVLIIGADEVGTGSWVSGFHVGCVACDIVPFNRSVGRYLKDSKAMSEGARERAVPAIKEHASAWSVVEAPLNAIAKSHKGAWRQAMRTAVVEVVGKLPPDTEYRLIIDGEYDERLYHQLVKRGSKPIFQHRADTRYPAVMAAAILAKTTRDALMCELDQLYPEFGFAKNKGYGVPAHIEACRKYGVTEHHRLIRRLRDCMPYDPDSQWFHPPSEDSE